MIEVIYMAKSLDLTGKRFGKLVAIKKVASRNKNTYWLCQCDCGNQKEIQTGNLTSGRTTSCGCNHTVPINRGLMNNISDEEFAMIVLNSSSLKEIVIKCGYKNYSGASCNIIKRRIQKQNLSTEHFQFPQQVKRTDEEIFIEDSPVNQTTLRRRYLNGKFTEYKCAICGQEPFWNNKELVLTLDHINGKNHDDRLINLRWICPNCDRQLETFAGKNHKIK